MGTVSCITDMAANSIAQSLKTAAMSSATNRLLRRAGTVASEHRWGNIVETAQDRAALTFPPQQCTTNKGATMKRILVFVMALMTVLAVPIIAEARHGGGHHGGGHGHHFGGHHGGHFGHRGFRGHHFRGGRDWGHRGHWRGDRHWGHRGHWRGRYWGHRRYWHGRWWAYGVGSCWRWSPYNDRFVWVCY